MFLCIGTISGQSKKRSMMIRYSWPAWLQKSINDNLLEWPLHQQLLLMHCSAKCPVVIATWRVAANLIHV